MSPANKIGRCLGYLSAGIVPRVWRSGSDSHAFGSDKDLSSLQTWNLTSQLIKGLNS